MSFFRFFAQRPMLANITTLLIILMGFGSLATIKRDAFPSVEFGELLITTVYPGASPEDVELMVTNEIEEQLKEVTGLKHYISWSRENVSTVHVVVDPDVNDEDKVIREVREAVSRVTDLPKEVTEAPLITELSTASFPMIEIGIAGDINYRELREVARNFQRKLEKVTGVSRVGRYGYQAREVKIEINPDKLESHDISLGEVVRAIGLRNIRATGGSFESYTSEQNIVTLAQFREPAEVGDVIVRTTFDGPSIKISDLAYIRDDFEEEKILSRVNGEEAISLIAFKSENADMIRTVAEIRKLVEKQRAYLPEGVEMLLSNDESQYVRDRLSIVANNGLLGLCMVLIVLALFLNLRIAFWVALGIPVTLLGAIFLLPIFDSFLDSITMTAMVLVIGIIVDDAIIIAESIYQHYEKGKSAVEAAVDGVADVIKPVATTILTTLIVFIPMFFMPGMLGKFVYVIPLVITLSLFISLIESTVALPAHIAGGLKNKIAPKSDKPHFFDRLKARYAKVLNKVLVGRHFLLLLFIGLLSGAIYYASRYMDFILFPSSSAERFIIMIETPTGTSLKATSDRTRQVEEIVSQLDKNELDSFVTRVGTFGEVGSSERENNAAVYVSLTSFASRERTADEIVADLRSKTDKLENVRIIYNINSGGPPVGRPITIRVVGPNDDIRSKLADDVVTFLQTFPGATDIDRDDKVGKSQVEIKFDYDKLARVGVSVADVARNVRIAYDGEVVTNVRYGDEDVDFRVIFTEQVRKDPDSLGKLTLPNRNGYLTPLTEIARFVSTPGPANFTHYDGDRTVTITGDVDTEITTSLKVSQSVNGKFNVELDYPGTELLIGGEAEESQKSVNELMIIMGISCVGMYLLLTLLFNSIWQPIIVMMAIPFGLLGVIIGFSIHNMALGFLGLIGIIGLAGVVVNDSLVLVAHINELRKREPGLKIRQIVAIGTSNRLRAVILTTVSTVAGLLPLAYGIGGADPYMGPMALALGWGLLFATPLTLVLIPSLYLIGEDIVRLFVKNRAN